MGDNSRYWDLYFIYHSESSSYLTLPAGTYYYFYILYNHASKLDLAKQFVIAPKVKKKSKLRFVTKI